MRRMTILILLLTVGSMFASSRIKSSYPRHNLSLLYGLQQNSNLAGQGFELLYERHRHSCVGRIYPSYVAFGLNNSWGANYSELGLRAAINPTRWGLIINRKMTLMPYLYIQGSSLFQNLDGASTQHWTYRPGLGLNFDYRKNRRWAFKTSFQIGNTLGESIPNPGWHFELRTGVTLTLDKWAYQKARPVPKF